MNPGAQCHRVGTSTGLLTGPGDTVIRLSVLQLPGLEESPLCLEEKNPDPLWRLQVLTALPCTFSLRWAHGSHTYSVPAFGLSVCLSVWKLLLFLLHQVILGETTSRDPVTLCL